MKVKMLVAFFIIVVCLVTLGRIDAQGEVTAYDADNQFLGILMGSTGGAANIFVPSSETVISITYNDGDALKGSLYFASFNCSGIAYMTVQQSYDIKKVGENYYIGEKVAPVDMRMNSIFSHWNLTCNSSGHDYDVVPAVEIDPPISLPVALPISFEYEPAQPGKWGK